MNIGFDAKRVFFNDSGLGNFSRDYLLNLSKFSSHNLNLFTPKEPRDKYQSFAEKPFHIIRGGGIAWRQYFIYKDIRKSDIDVYHGLSHEIPFSSYKFNIPTVVTMHDVIFKRFSGDFPVVDREIYSAKWKYALHNADRIHAISKSTADDLIKYYNADPQKIQVIPLALSPRLSSHKPSLAVTEKYQLEEDFFFYVGDLGKRKNINSLLEAYSLAGSSGAKVNLPKLKIISRDLKGIQRLKKTSDNLKINKVEFHSSVSDAELRSFYECAIALIYPSEYEGFGLPVLEAMQCGTPVISSDAGSLPEVGGDAVLYFKPDKPDEILNRMKQLSSDSKLQSELSDKGISRAKKFNPESITKDMLELYNF